MTSNSIKIIAISGGIGGAKLALGLDRIMPASNLSIVANTGDDFEHLGLYISPDVDTLLYTLAELNNTELGWGRRDESWNFAEAAAALGMETWFQLGDRDLATHLYRSQRLRQGLKLSEVVDELRVKFGIASQIIPMSDEPVRTTLRTSAGTLNFQEYFVKNRCEPVVQEIFYEGIQSATITTQLLTALDDPELAAIVICPSNPFLSVQPILELPGIKAKLGESNKPIIVVSPIIGGKSVKGPTSKLMQELGLDCEVTSIAEIYKDIASDIIIDTADQSLVKDIKGTGLIAHTASIMMNKLQDKTSLAEKVLQIAISHS